jgi:hypothetical protein
MEEQEKIILLKCRSGKLRVGVPLVLLSESTTEAIAMIKTFEESGLIFINAPNGFHVQFLEEIKKEHDQLSMSDRITESLKELAMEIPKKAPEYYFSEEELNKTWRPVVINTPLRKAAHIAKRRIYKPQHR